MIIVTVCHQALRRPVPPCGDVLGKGRLGIDPSARSEISKLHLVIFDQYVLTKETLINILRLDVSMENAVFMHVVDRLQHLVQVELDPLFRQMIPPSFDGFIHIHIHKLKY